MKKHITLAILSGISLVGGSWLAAQQDVSERPSRPQDGVTSTSPLASPGALQPARGTQVTKTERAASEVRGPANAARYEKLFSENPAISTIQEVQAREVPIYGAVPGMSVPFAVSREVVRMSPEDAARMRAFQDAIRELRGAENDDDKAAAREVVTKLVSEQLDSDLASREKELVAIEQRALELRKQLDERKTAKPELLKMLVMLIDNPQVGLGIPPEWMQMLMRGQPNSQREYFYMGQNRVNILPGLPDSPQPAMPPQPSATPSGTRTPNSR